MAFHRFYIDTHTIDGLARIREKYGEKMVGLIMGQWMVDHQMIPSKDVDYSDDFVETDSGIVIPARVFTQEHSFFRED